VGYLAKPREEFQSRDMAFLGLEMAGLVERCMGGNLHRYIQELRVTESIAILVSYQ
jgi:hypothetical protein